MKSLLFRCVECLAEALCVSSVLVMTCLADPPRYRITNLGSLDNGFSNALSVNDAGQVVGQSSAESGEARHAFLYSEGVMEDLGTFARNRSEANDINESGLVTGSSDTADGRAAFLYADGVMQDISQNSGTLGSTGWAINDHGEITGNRRTAESDGAFIYTEGKMQPIERPPETDACDEFQFTGFGINNSTQITGIIHREIAGNRCHDRAFLYSHDSGEMILIGDLLPDFGTVGYDINDSGQVVVQALGTGDSGAFLYSDWEMIRIGGPDFIPWGINNAGWVVGQTNSGGPDSRAFLYMEGQVYDLNDLVTDMSGWDQLRDAREISDSGYIAGTGRTESGDSRAFLLTPLDVKVKINVRPGNKQSKVNLRSHGNIPVAILSTRKFDATQVDWETVRFGPKEAKERHEQIHLKDLQNDGDMDAVLHFRIRQTGIRCEDKKVTLTGKTFSGVAFRGTGNINVVKCRG